jgi:hypothetical protein
MQLWWLFAVTGFIGFCLTLVAGATDNRRFYLGMIVIGASVALFGVTLLLGGPPGFFFGMLLVPLGAGFAFAGFPIFDL